MRGLSLVDVLIVLAVLALLLYAGSREFGRFENRAFVPTPVATPQETPS